jgi:ABC-2 type transport system ATP-binding protein
VERICDRVIVLAKGRIVADANPQDLVRLMALPDLEAVFAQLVRQTDTNQVARQIVEVMRT